MQAQVDTVVGGGGVAPPPSPALRASIDEYARREMQRKFKLLGEHSVTALTFEQFAARIGAGDSEPRAQRKAERVAFLGDVAELLCTRPRTSGFVVLLPLCASVCQRACADGTVGDFVLEHTGGTDDTLCVAGTGRVAHVSGDCAEFTIHDDGSDTGRSRVWCAVGRRVPWEEYRAIVVYVVAADDAVASEDNEMLIADAAM